MNEEWQDETEVIQHIIVDYFSGLYQTSVTDARLTENERVNTISGQQSEELLVAISYEEVKKAVFSMHPEKAPGPNGFNPAFFQTY